MSTVQNDAVQGRVGVSHWQRSRVGRSRHGW